MQQKWEYNSFIGSVYM